MSLKWFESSVSYFTFPLMKALHCQRDIQSSSNGFSTLSEAAEGSCEVPPSPWLFKVPLWIQSAALASACLIWQSADERDCTIILGWGYLHRRPLFQEQQAGTPPRCDISTEKQDGGGTSWCPWGRLSLRIRNIPANANVGFAQCQSKLSPDETETDGFYSTCWIIYFN